MECKDIQQNILNGITDTNTEKHLSDCEECQIFQDSMEQFLAARPDVDKYVPAEKLDYEVKKEARIFIEKQMKAYNAEGMTKLRIIPNFASYLAAAACAALVSWLVIISLQPKSKNNNTENNTKINSNIDTPNMTWEQLSMDDDFFSITTDIEMNYIMLNATFPDAKAEEKEEEELKDKVNLIEEEEE